MKRIIFITLLLVGGWASAKPVDPDIAMRVAQNLLGRPVVDATPADFSQCFLFTGADGKGFVLVAADDCVRPVLAYSHSDTFPGDPLPQHIHHWLTAYQSNIAALADAGAVPSSRVSDEWQQCLSAKFHRTRDNAVPPLLTTRWNQGYPYNIQCPYSIPDSAYSVTGCVATAMAQVMKYWNHPAVGRGSHSYSSNFGNLSARFDTTHYDWAHMPDSPGWQSTDAERNAVAQLMFHVGVSVDMDYSPHSSGAHVTLGNNSQISAENALKNNFRYNQALFAAAKIDYTDTEWDALLTAELDAARPLLFSGTDGNGGHAFVVDGYDSLGFFHLNWGWGGYCDGYYTLDSLNPDGSGIGGNATNGYNIDTKAVMNIFPASEAPSVTVAAVSADSLTGSVSGGGTFASYAPAISLMATAAEGHRFVTWKSGNHYNPFRFSPNNDFYDTAIFAPIVGDTLGYCYSNYKQLWGDADSYPLSWGIRLPASAIAHHRQLEKVQFYSISNADYTVYVYSGTMPDRLLFSTRVSTDRFEWKTVTLPNPVPLYEPTPIWIVLSCGTYSNPATASTYSGNPDGSWYKRHGSTWEPATTRGEYFSWMIRGILGPLMPVDVDVQSSNLDMGTVSGGGSYYPGDTAVLLATPAPGYRFAGWSTGDTDNPLYLRVTGTNSIIASFLPAVAIDDVEDDSFGVMLEGLTLLLYEPDGHEISVYDLQGRRLATLDAGHTAFTLPAPGAYLLHSGTSSKTIVAP